MNWLLGFISTLVILIIGFSMVVLGLFVLAPVILGMMIWSIGSIFLVGAVIAAVIGAALVGDWIKALWHRWLWRAWYPYKAWRSRTAGVGDHMPGERWLSPSDNGQWVQLLILKRELTEVYEHLNRLPDYQPIYHVLVTCTESVKAGGVGDMRMVLNEEQLTWWLKEYCMLFKGRLKLEGPRR